MTTTSQYTLSATADIESTGTNVVPSKLTCMESTWVPSITLPLSVTGNDVVMVVSE